MGEKTRIPGVVLTSKWWMQRYMRAQDPVKKENTHSRRQGLETPSLDHARQKWPNQWKKHCIGTK
eukprot:12893112-Prorocentrum_lima.AAC.1